MATLSEQQKLAVRIEEKRGVQRRAMTVYSTKFTII